MYKLTLLLSTVAVFTFCEAAIIAKRNDGCGELMGCLAHFSSLQSANISSITLFTDEDKYDELCQANDDFQSCFAANKDDCEDPSVINHITSPAQILDYLCSDEGREGLDTIADSPCVTDKTAPFEAQRGMEECLQDFQTEFQNALSSAITGQGAPTVDICSFTGGLTSCITSTLTVHCGSEFGTFGEQIWNMAFKPVAAQMGCNLEARQIRNLKNRFFPLVLAGAKRRR